MADGIRFLIELDGKTAGAADAVKGLKDVEKAADGAGHSLGELGRKEFPNLTRDIFKAEFALDALKEGAHLALRGIEALGDVIKDTVNAAAAGERTHAVFENMLGEHSGETLDYLREWSRLTEFSQHETKDFGAELLRAGYSGDKFHDAMAAIADSASLSTNKVEGAQEALSSLVRMNLTGKLDARTLRGLRLDVRDVTKDLGNALGMTPEAVKEGLEAGTIPAAAAFNSVLGSIEKKTGKQLGEAGLGMGKGLESSLTKLKELPDAIMKGVTGSAGMADIQAGIDKMLTAFDPKSEAGKAMIDGLSSLIGEVGKAFKNVDWLEVGKDVKSLTQDLAGLIGPLAKTAGFVVDIYKALHGMGERIGESLGERDLQYQREQNRTIKNRHLTGEIGAPEMEAAQADDKKKQNDANYEAAMARFTAQPAISSMPPLSAAAGGTSSSKVTTNHIGAPQVTVNLYGSHGNAQETGQAVAEGAAKGTSAAMTESLQNFSSVMERNATMSGLGP